jgi:hypothetical protein
VAQSGASVGLSDRFAHGVGTDGCVAWREPAHKHNPVVGLRAFVLQVCRNRLAGRRRKWQDVLAPALRKALEDCTTSLKYGRLPDALQKQQELVKMLKGSPTI